MTTARRPVKPTALYQDRDRDPDPMPESEETQPPYDPPMTTEPRAVTAETLAAALYRVVGSVTDARVAELMQHAAIPLHGHPISNAAGYVAALIRSQLSAGIEAALSAPHPDPEPREGLREGLTAYEREWLDATPPAGHPLIHGIFQRLPDRLAALRVEPSSIDVERLGRAIASVEVNADPVAADFDVARRYAAQYDRLTPEATRAERTRE